MKDYSETEGNNVVILLTKDDGEVTHFYTWSFWEDLASIKRFAGDQYEKARYYDEDRQFLLEFQSQATHFDILEIPEFVKRKF